MVFPLKRYFDARQAGVMYDARLQDLSHVHDLPRQEEDEDKPDTDMNFNAPTTAVEGGIDASHEEGKIRTCTTPRRT